VPDSKCRRTTNSTNDIFNAGYTATAGPQPLQVELTDEAIRLTRELHHIRPLDDEIAGLLALLLTDARRPARLGPNGELVSLAEQNRQLWNRDLIDEGVALVESALAHGPLGPYQLQAAIAAVHDEAATVETTDWLQILALFDLLAATEPNPITTLNRSVAVAHALGPDHALRELARLAADPRVNNHHLYNAVLGHTLELAGQRAEAATEFTKAARRTASAPERDALLRRAAKLAPHPPNNAT
jgi:predicted RNA polymerase sigma factor